MLTISDYLSGANSIWQINQDFHAGKIDVVHHQFIVSKKCFDNAGEILALPPSHWLQSSNPLLANTSVQESIQHYIIEHKLAASFITEEDIRANPNLLIEFKMDLQCYPSLLKDSNFHENYLLNCLTSSVIPNKDIIQQISFASCFKIMKKVQNNGSAGRDFYKNIQTILTLQMSKGVQYIKKDIFPCLDKKTPAFIKQELIKVLDRHIVLKKIILGHLPVASLLYCKSDLLHALIDAQMKKPFTPEVVDYLYHQMVNQYGSINLKDIKKYNPDGALKLFMHDLKTKPLLEVTYKEALRTQRSSIQYKVDPYKMGIFDFFDLSPITQCYVYFQAKEKGLDYLAWLIPPSSYPVHTRVGKKIIDVPLTDIDAYYRTIENHLTTLLGEPIDTWVDTQKNIASVIINSPKRLDYEKMIIAEFKKKLDVHQGNAVSLESQEELNLLF